MFITKKAIPRRTFMRGIGVTVALPLLDAMVPALSAMAKTVANPVRRLGCIYLPNGMNMNAWTPAEAGEGFELSSTLTPLAPLKDHVTVVSGLDHEQAEAWGEGGGEHNRAPSTWLNATRPKRTEGAHVQAGTTIDQIIAQAVGHDTRFSSLELTVERLDLVGSCSATGYSCIYTDTISWRTPTTPLPMENNPRRLFERMFGEGANSAERRALTRETRSILDGVTDELAGFQKTLGPSDRLRVNEYLDSIRDVERRIQKVERQGVRPDFEVPARPAGIPDTFEEYCKMMFDLQLLAYQADFTRVITFMMGHENSNRTYPNIGVRDAYHATSHHQNDPQKLAKIAAIDRYHVQLLTYYLEKLHSTADGDGSLLDHALILYGAGLSNGNTHSHLGLPLLVAGGGGARHGRHGRHLRYPSGTPMANLLVTLADRMDVPMASLGDSTGQLKDFAHTEALTEL